MLESLVSTDIKHSPCNDALIHLWQSNGYVVSLTEEPCCAGGLVQASIRRHAHTRQLVKKLAALDHEFVHHPHRPAPAPAPEPESESESEPEPEPEPDITATSPAPKSAGMQPSKAGALCAPALLCESWSAAR